MRKKALCLENLVDLMRIALDQYECQFYFIQAKDWFNCELKNNFPSMHTFCISWWPYLFSCACCIGLRYTRYVHLMSSVTTAFACSSCSSLSAPLAAEHFRDAPASFSDTWAIWNIFKHTKFFFALSWK